MARKFEDGTLVVVNCPEYPDSHGFVGLYKYRGDEFRTCLVVQGCSVLMVYPESVEQYSQYQHGKPSMKGRFS